MKKVSKMIIPTEGHIGNGDLLKEEGIQARVEDHLIEGGIPIGIEGLLEEEDILKENPLMEMEDPLTMEDLLMEMEDPLDPLVDKDHQVLKDLLDQ